MDSILAELRKIPPVTRFLAISLIGITGTSLLNLVSAYKLIYVQRFVFSKFEFDNELCLIFYTLKLWRLYTSFFLGSGGISFIFEDDYAIEHYTDGPSAPAMLGASWNHFQNPTDVNPET
ncbi:endoplasmic reticulum protein [Moniliophthora roreri]|nr:endoplasmic reticulum protein [Moniliophthora roreri]